MVDPVKRICVWSGPRNVSTALMYSFAQRSDTEVVDEPLYAHFLQVTAAQHPLRELCLAAQDQDGARVVKQAILGPRSKPVVFFKQMAHHLVDLNLDFMKQTWNVFLTRAPEQVLPSLQLRIGQPQLRDTGFARQCELIEMLEAWGQSPAVLDSRDLLRAPAVALEALCNHLEIPYEAQMLHWPAGPKQYDGVWASAWYANVHRTTGFRPDKPKSDPFPPQLQPLLEECKPYYSSMLERSIRPGPARTP